MINQANQTNAFRETNIIHKYYPYKENQNHIYITPPAVLVGNFFLMRIKLASDA